MIKQRKYLFFAAFLYGGVISLRNSLFNIGILKEEEYDIPIICVGNVTVGGTGKTPITEYLTRLLKSEYRIAVLSRGYKRKTSGFILADEKSDSKTIGDEPFQLFKKFPDILVAVDKNRRRGIKKLLNLGKDKAPEVILLDDAFQYRYVKPGFSVLLTNYNRPIYEDVLMPVGLLREQKSATSRANAVIVMKCPEGIKPGETQIIEKKLNLFPYQKLFFSSLCYQKLKPLFLEQNEIDLDFIDENITVLLITGIASPQPLADKIKSLGCRLEHLKYPDHHWFTKSDLNKMEKKYVEIKSEKKIIIVTEKDAGRLIDCNFRNDDFKKNIYYIPVETRFLQDNEHIFNHLIQDYVRTYKRNSIIPL